MTLDEATTLAAIAETVDNGCEYCIAAVVEKLNRAFPDFWWEQEGEAVRVRPNPQRQKEAVR